MTSEMLQQLGDSYNPDVEPLVELPSSNGNGAVPQQRRRRGRPPRVSQPEGAPLLEQDEPRRETTQPRRRRGSAKINELKGQLSQGIQMLDAIMQSMSTKYTPYALQPPEIDALSGALAVEVDQNSRLQALAAKAGTLTPHIALATVCFSIALPRISLYLQTQQKQPEPPRGRGQPARPQPVADFVPPDRPDFVAADDNIPAAPSSSLWRG